MTNPRQLAPTVGLSHDGFEFLKGSFDGLKGYAVGRMTKSRCGKLYIDDAIGVCGPGKPLRFKHWGAREVFPSN